MASVPLCASLAYGAILAFAGLWDGVQMGGLAIGELNRDGHSIDQSNHVWRRRTTIERRNNSQGAADSEPYHVTAPRGSQAPLQAVTSCRSQAVLLIYPLEVILVGAVMYDDAATDAAASAIVRDPGTVGAIDLAP